MTDNIPLLYSSTETSFIHAGIGYLVDYIDWNVEENRNGPYELDMIYPIDGLWYSSIELRSIIVAKPNPYDDPQPFRVYEITKPINGKVKIFAKHLSYDLNGIPVEPFTATNAQGAAVLMNNKSIVENPFTMHTDVSVVANMSFDKPTIYRSLMGGNEGSILDVYGGEYYYDWYDVYLKHARGEDRSVVIRYGKNMSSLEQDENCENVYTGIIGYWTSTGVDSETGVENTICVRSDIIYFEDDPDYIRIYMQDFTDVFPDEPDVTQLNQAAVTFAEANGINIPDVSLTVTFEQDPECLETVKLCDILTVEFEQLGISTKAKVIKTVYNGPRDRFTSIDIGDAKSTFGSTLHESISTSLSESKIDMILQAREIIKRIEDTADGIMVSVSENSGRTTTLEQTYNNITEKVASLEASLSYIIDDSSATWQFANAFIEKLNEQNEYVTNAIRDIGAYIRFSTEQNNPYIILGWNDPSGQTTSNFTKLKIFSDKMFFYNGEDTVANIDGSDSNGNVIATVFAYFTNSELTAKTLRVGGQGNLNTYVFTRRDNGHLTLRLA